MNAHLERLQDSLALATQGMDPQDLERRPDDGKWSGAEILEHLNLTYTATMKNFERSLSAGHALGSVPTIKDRIRAMLVVGFGYFPSGREAPKATVPGGKPAENVMAEIRENIPLMDKVLHESQTKFGKKTYVANHPILGPLTVNQWCKFHWVHGRHHIQQVLRLRGR